MQKHPTSCHKNDTLHDAAFRMSLSASSFLPVVNENEELVGTITNKDVQRAIEMKDLTKDNLLVGDLMHAESYSVNAYDDEAAALKTMRKNNTSHLPVVDDKNQLKGIVSFITLARRIIQLKNDLKKDDEKLRVRGLGLSNYNFQQAV